MREIELDTGEVIEDVTRTSRADDGLVNVHTPGSGHRVVNPESIVRDEGTGDDE